MEVNYFELYEMPLSLLLPYELVIQKYYALIRQYHPDHQTMNSESSQNSLTMSAHINKAKYIFSDIDRTIAYVLQLKGKLDDEKNKTLSPSFLMKMMDISEQIAQSIETQDQIKIQQLSKEVEQYKQDAFDAISPTLYAYPKEERKEIQEAMLKQVAKYFYEKKYLDRLFSGMNL